MYFLLATLAALEVCTSATIALCLGPASRPQREAPSLCLAVVPRPSSSSSWAALTAFCWPVGGPLCYTLMSWGLDQEAECAQLLTPLCGSRELSLFCGDVLPAMGLARADTWVQKSALFVVSVTVLNSLFLLFSCAHIVTVVAIPRIRSAEGGTGRLHLPSHLTGVLLQHSCGSLTHLCPSSSCCLESGQVVSVVYTFIVPVPNP